MLRRSLVLFMLCLTSLSLPYLAFAGKTSQNSSGTLTSSTGASAGLDQVASTGTPVILDGTGSLAGRGYSYLWSFVDKPAGSQASITEPTALKTSFTPDLPGFYHVKLSVTNAKGKVIADAMTVYAGNADVIRSDTTWTHAGSPYTLTKDVIVDYGATLNIEPGVVIYGNSHALQVWGQLNASGTSAAKISFEGVKILPGFNDYYLDNRMYIINVQFAEIINGSSIHPVVPGAKYGNLQLLDSLIKDAPHIYLWNPLGDNYIERNVFVNTSINAGVGIPNRVFIRNNSFNQTLPLTGCYGVSVWMAGDPAYMVVTKNSFLNTSLVALSLIDGASTGAITATENYWGTTASWNIDAMIHDKNDSPTSPNYVTYTPYLTAPDPATPDSTPHL